MNESAAQEAPLPKRTGSSPASASEISGTIMQFKVWLSGLSPMVWRRVHVPATFTLRQLHGVIQIAMGWEGIHLFQFRLRGEMFRTSILDGFKLMPRIFAYVRVSTTGQTTENQIREIEAAGFRVEPRRIVSETISGSTATAQRRFKKTLSPPDRSAFSHNQDPEPPFVEGTRRGNKRLEADIRR